MVAGWSGGGWTTPSGPGGGSAAHWAKHVKNKFWAIGPRGAAPPLGPLGRSRGSWTTPSGPGGGLAVLWAKHSNYSLAQGAAEPPLGPLGVVRSPLDSRPGCGRTTLGQTGWPSTTYGMVWPPQHIFLIFFFLKKKNVMGHFGNK